MQCVQPKTSYRREPIRKPEISLAMIRLNVQRGIIDVRMPEIPQFACWPLA